MSLEVLVTSALREAFEDEPADDLMKDLDKASRFTTEQVVKELEDTPIRAEVWEQIQYDVNEGVSIADVHLVMDALVRVLKGENQ